MNINNKNQSICQTIRSSDFIGEVDMTWSVKHIQQVRFVPQSLHNDGNGSRLDRTSSLDLQKLMVSVSRVCPFRSLKVGMSLFHQTINKGRLSMPKMTSNSNVSNKMWMLHQIDQKLRFVYRIWKILLGYLNNISKLFRPIYLPQTS